MLTVAWFCTKCRLEFDDLHVHGIYSWGLLHEMGSHGKWRRMRSYLQRLRERGLTREPPRLRSAAARQ